MRTRARRIIRSLTYANIMATLAVFLVLGGGSAYAAQMVRSQNIVDDQVYSVDVRDDTLSGGGLQAQDIAPGAIGASELGTDSVAFDELAFGTLPRFTYQKQASTATDATTEKNLTVTCSNRSTDAVTGGGFVIAQSQAGGNVPGVVVERSYAVSSNSWVVRAFATSGTPTWQLTVIASCIG